MIARDGLLNILVSHFLSRVYVDICETWVVWKNEWGSFHGGGWFFPQQVCLLKPVDWLNVGGYSCSTVASFDEGISNMFELLL